MNTLIRSLSSFVALTLGATAIAASALPAGINNSAYVYDAKYVGGVKTLKIGSMATELGPFIESNAANTQNNQTILYTYGTDLELTGCSAGDSPNCKLNLFYTKDANPYNGQANTEAYKTALSKYNNVAYAPIVEGDMWDNGDGAFGDMNKLSPGKIQSFADQVANTLCADPNVSGITFDIEPYNATTEKNQNIFYSRVGADLAGSNSAAVPSCKTTQYPNGRYFSAFISPNDLNSGLANALNAHQNGYVILSLYDLAGKALNNSNPGYYGKIALNTLKTFEHAYQNNPVPYQIAIPASASTEEFEGCNNIRPLPANVKPSQARSCTVVPIKPAAIGTQVLYVKAAIQAIQKGIVPTPGMMNKFMGITFWAFQPQMEWKFVSLYPSIPTASTWEAVNTAKL